MSLAYATENVVFHATQSSGRSSLPPSPGTIRRTRSASEPLVTFQDISPSDKDSAIENNVPDIDDNTLDGVTEIQTNDHGTADVELLHMDDEPVDMASSGRGLAASEDLLGTSPARSEGSCVERGSDLASSKAMDVSNSTPTKSPKLVSLSPVPTNTTVDDVSTGENSPAANMESPNGHDAPTIHAEVDMASSVDSDSDDDNEQSATVAYHDLPEHVQEDTCNVDVAMLADDTVCMDIVEESLQNAPESTEQRSTTRECPLSPIRTPVGTPTKFPPQPEIDPLTPILEDATATLTITTMNQLEDDKAFLRSFLDRAAASKVVKVPVSTEDGDKSSCTRRESLQNRRDSDVVRQALASPRQPLEQKDGNLFSPPVISKPEDVPPKSTEPSIADGLILPPIDELLKAGRTSPRRSGRTRTTRSMISGPSKERTQISVRLNEGNDTINVTKAEAQVTAIVTRRNTRKNKGAALSVPDRLVKWRADVEVLGTTPDPTNPSTKTKRVEWTATICFLDQTTGMQGVEPLVDGSSNPDDELHPPDSVPSVPPARSTRTTRSSTPKYRKLRGLGAGNSTPAKAMLSSTLLPDELAEDTAAPQETPRPAGQKKRAADAAPPAAAGAAAGKGRGGAQQSRIPHSRKRLSLNPSVRSVAAAVREDTLRLFGPGGAAAAGAVGTAKVQVQVPASLLPVAGKAAAAKKTARKGDV
jgi:hypothetical protein